MLPSHIFKAYDIRGIAGSELSYNHVCLIAQAIGSEALLQQQSSIIVARDGRLSSPELFEAVKAGLVKTGIHVIDIGSCPSPIAYFATHHLNFGNAIMLTGSHNPPEYNGLKIVLNFAALSGEQIKALYERIQNNQLINGATTASISKQDVRHAYIERVCRDIHLARPLRICVDCGNGIAGNWVGELYRELGCSVTELFCDVDGSFPNHHPDPTQLANLSDLVTQMQTGQFDIGLAFDGDGDRLGVVSSKGELIYSDRIMMLFAQQLLHEHSGAEIICDIKSSQQLLNWIEQLGGKATLWKAGHSLIKAKMRETGSLLASETTGHYFFKHRWYGFDDGLYAGARLLELLSSLPDINYCFDMLTEGINTPEIHIPVSEGQHHQIIAALQDYQFKDSQSVLKIDGLRVQYTDGFGLIRASNTTPNLMLRFEANSTERLAQIQAQFKTALKQVAPELNVTF